MLSGSPSRPQPCTTLPGMSSSTLPHPRGIIRSSIALVSTLALAAVLTACGSDDGDNETDTGSSGETSSVQTLEDGTLTVCSDIPYPPFEDFDESAPRASPASTSTS